MGRTNIFISSETIQNVTNNGSTVTLTLNEPLNVYNKLLRVTKSNIWYTFPNIDGVLNNNTISFTYNAIPYLLTFPKGLYSFDDINESLAEMLINLGLSPSLFTFIADEATSLSSLYIVPIGLPFSVTFSSGQNLLLSSLLGFSQAGTVTTSANLYVDSLSRANLNVVNSIYINCSFAGGSSYYNNISGSTIISAVAIDVAPGSQINTESNNPPLVECVGGSVSTFTVWLCDQTNIKHLDLNGEYFSLTMELIDKTELNL